MLERTNENMSELRRNAIRRKSKPKQTAAAGSSSEKCAESSGEWSGQVRAESPLMGLFLLVPNDQTLGAFVSGTILSAQLLSVSTPLKEHSFGICVNIFFCQLGNIMLQNLLIDTLYLFYDIV